MAGAGDRARRPAAGTVVVTHLLGRRLGRAVAPVTQPAHEGQRVAQRPARFGRRRRRRRRERREDGHPVRMRKGAAVRRQADAVRVEALVVDVRRRARTAAVLETRIQIRARRRTGSASLSPTAKGRFNLLLQPRNAADVCCARQCNIHKPKPKPKPKPAKFTSVQFTSWPTRTICNLQLQCLHV